MVDDPFPFGGLFIFIVVALILGFMFGDNLGDVLNKGFGLALILLACLAIIAFIFSMIVLVFN
tara:strand:- start:264 stop:452 length:189 start_codon:yes stop_codon:yes gene_type:complete